MVKKVKSRTIKETIKDGNKFLGKTIKKRTGTIQQTLDAAKNIVKKRATRTIQATIKDGKKFLANAANNATATAQKAAAKVKTAAKKAKVAAHKKAPAKKAATKKTAKKWFLLFILCLFISVSIRLLNYVNSNVLAPLQINK